MIVRQNDTITINFTRQNDREVMGVSSMRKTFLYKMIGSKIKQNDRARGKTIDNFGGFSLHPPFRPRNLCLVDGDQNGGRGRGDISFLYT